MPEEFVTCESCTREYVYSSEQLVCPHCGDPREHKDTNPEPPGTVRTIVTEIPDKSIPTPYELEMRRRRIARIALAAILTIIAAWLAIRYLGNTVHTETTLVVGFSWKTEVDVHDEKGNIRTEVLEGIGKTFTWPNVQGRSGEVLNAPKSYYYLLLQNPNNKVYKPFQVSKEIWEQLSFNDRVTAQVDGLGNIHSVSIR